MRNSSFEREISSHFPFQSDRVLTSVWLGGVGRTYGSKTTYHRYESILSSRVKGYINPVPGRLCLCGL